MSDQGNTQDSDARYRIYQFDDKRDSQIIYIGLTDNLDRRTREHLRKDGLLYPLAQELRKEGLKLLPSIIDSSNDLEEARCLEKMHIQQKRPLLNIIHNQEGIREYRQVTQYAETLADLMENSGLSYREAVTFHENFNCSEGDYHSYKLIRKTAQLVRGQSGGYPFTESEILALALQISRIDEVGL